MKIAIIGSGGREHAIAWKFSQSLLPTDIYLIGGNGGTLQNIQISPTDFEKIHQFCIEKNISLIFVGTETPLAAGIVDYFRQTDIAIIGPTQAAARLESSKIFAKQFMARYGVATAPFWVPQSRAEAEEIIEQLGGKLVIKYDGLAAGKGVVVCQNTEEAYQAYADMLARYGENAPLLIEDLLTGWEVSIIGFTDGNSFSILLPTQDHKRLLDNDQGPNTGGMGAYCPVPAFNEAWHHLVEKDIIAPTLNGIQAEQLDYRGIIYFGVMITETGPFLLEYNVRLGDPEAEVLMPMLKSNLLELCYSCLDRRLHNYSLLMHEGYCIDVVLASAGYPSQYQNGYLISGFGRLHPDTFVFHAGTTRLPNGDILTHGGRVLNVVVKGDSPKEVRQRVYAECEKITFDGMFYRKDIGVNLLASNSVP